MVTRKWSLGVVVLAACSEHDRVTPSVTSVASPILTACDAELSRMIDERLAPGNEHAIEIVLAPNEHAEFATTYDIVVRDDLAVGVELSLESSTVERWLAESHASVTVRFDTVHLESLVTREHVLFGDGTLSPDVLAAALVDGGITFCGTRRVVGRAALETSLGIVDAIVALHVARDPRQTATKADCPLFASNRRCDGRKCEVKGFRGKCEPGETPFDRWFCSCD